MAISPVVRDAATADFFDGTRRGVFLLRRRRSTGEYLDPGTVPDQPDDADLEYAPAGGGARVVSWSTLRRTDGDKGELVRTVVGIVELDEGPWWWTQLVDVDPDGDLAGLRVQVDFEASGPDPEHEVVPVFRPARPERQMGVGNLRTEVPRLCRLQISIEVRLGVRPVTAMRLSLVIHAQAGSRGSWILTLGAQMRSLPTWQCLRRSLPERSLLCHCIALLISLSVSRMLPGRLSSIPSSVSCLSR